MVKRLAIRQGYRLYAAVLVIWAAVSAIWVATSLQLSPTTVGYGWLSLAALGVPLVGGLYVNSPSVFTGSERAMNRFTASSLSGTPLGLYAASIVAWSAVFVAWLSGAVMLSPEIVAGGWFAIAAYGAVLTIGLVSLHREKVMEAINLHTLEQDSL